MKTLGLIGGMSWESTLTYYRLINQGVNARLGGYHSAKLLLYSVDFADIESLQRADRWEEAADILTDAARALEKAGAAALVLCTNTMHKVASQIAAGTKLPFLHIADPTAKAIHAANFKKVGLLATRFTMEQAFYVQRLREVHGLEVILPDTNDRAEVHRVIYDELVHGRVLAASRRKYLDIVKRLERDGAQAIILGCTEIGMLLSSSNMSMPSFDTTELHSNAAVEYALSD
jgi:aspartate racemase